MLNYAGEAAEERKMGDSNTAAFSARAARVGRFLPKVV